MYFWNIKALKNELAGGTLNQNDDLNYLVATLALFTIAAYPFESNNIMDSYGWFTELILVILGTLFCFSANGGETGDDFLRRYLSIGWVMSIKLIALMIPIQLTLYAVIEILGYLLPEETSIFDLALVAGFSFIYYWRVSAHLKQLRDSGA